MSQSRFSQVDPANIVIGDWIKITPVCPCRSHASKKDGIKTGGIASTYPEICPSCGKVPPKPEFGVITNIGPHSVVFRRDGEDYVFNRWSTKVSYARKGAD